MTKDSNIPEFDGGSRRRAEERLHGPEKAGKCEPARSPTDADSQRLSHEIEVHLVELELQNAELTAARAKTEATLARYTDLYDLSPIGYLTLGSAGEILQVNLAGARILGQLRTQIIDRRIGTFVATSSLPAFNADLAQLFDWQSKESSEVTLDVAAPSQEVAHLDATVTKDRQTCRTMLSDITEDWHQETERVQQQARLSELSHRLVAVQEEGRRNFAAILHELVAPYLASQMIHLRVIDKKLPWGTPDNVRERLSETQAVLADTDASIRSLGAGLRSAVLDVAGLVPALDSYCHQFSRRTGMAFRLPCWPWATRLSFELESALFRIAQEALANCAKHSDAKIATLELTHEARDAVMTIADDGVGFDPPRVSCPGLHNGLGLLSTRERAEFVGAEWKLESHPGQRTGVSADLENVL